MDKEEISVCLTLPKFCLYLYIYQLFDILAKKMCIFGWTDGNFKYTNNLTSLGSLKL